VLKRRRRVKEREKSVSVFARESKVVFVHLSLAGSQRGAFQKSQKHETSLSLRERERTRQTKEQKKKKREEQRGREE